MQVHFSHLEEALGPRIYHQGKSYLYFAGTAYLGIPQHTGMHELYIKGLSKYGLNNGTSRMNNVQLGLYDKAEDFAANLFQAEAALITSSGYLAAQLAVNYFSGWGEFRYHPEVHPALLRSSIGAQYVTDINKENDRIDFPTWAKLIVDEINNSPQTKWVILSNSINNLNPERYNFKLFESIDKQKEVYFIIDDSHGIGLINGGAGIVPALPVMPQLPQVKWVVVASMAKALGIDAGLILGDVNTIHSLKSHEIFRGASPPSAAALFAFMHAKEIYALEWLKLQKNYQQLISALSAPEEWQYIPELPVLRYKLEGLANRLIEKNILISAFPYPNPDSPSLDRLVLSSWHSPPDIRDLIVSL